MIRDGKIHIPVNLFAFPFIAIFRLLRFAVLGVRSILTLVFLVSGIGTLVAVLSGGLDRKYTILDYEMKEDTFGRIKVEERPGWAERFLGARVRRNEYFAKLPEEGYSQYPYFTPDHQAISNYKRARIMCALKGFNVIKRFKA